ncbi:MAG: SWIM zinc finger family protein [bacterium]
MKIGDVTKEWIEHSTGSKTFQKGCDYYRNGMIYEMVYDPENHLIQAQVSGTFGKYKVTISDEDGKINVRCNCPSDNYICKHIVAVLLNFIAKKSKYIDKAAKQNTALTSFTARLNQCSHEELVRIIINAAYYNTEFKRELVAFLEPDIHKHWAIAQKIMSISKKYHIPDEKWEKVLDQLVANISQQSSSNSTHQSIF